MDLLQQYKRRGAGSARVDFQPKTASSTWYSAAVSAPTGRRGGVEHYTFASSAAQQAATAVSMKKEGDKPEKTIKKKQKEGKQYNGPMNDRDTSDANDSGPCWRRAPARSCAERFASPDLLLRVAAVTTSESPVLRSTQRAAAVRRRTRASRTNSSGCVA